MVIVCYLLFLITTDKSILTINIKQLFIVFLYGALILIPLVIWYSAEPETAVLNVFLSPLLGLFFWFERVKPLRKIDWFVFGILLAIFLTDLANINTQLNNSLVSLSLIFVIIYQAAYIYFMRHEKVRITFKGVKDLLKIGVPSLIFFAVFGIFFLDHPGNLEYILILISDLETTLLIILVLFRKTETKIFYTGVLGATLLGITNILYLLLNIDYLSINNVDILICCYWFSHFFLILSIIQSLNVNELTSHKA